MWEALTATATWVPAGTVTPFEKVKSFIIFRFIETRYTINERIPLRKYKSILLAPIAMRCDSLMKLSSLRSLPIANLFQPSDSMTFSTSSRKGAMYSGLATRSNNAFVKAYSGVKGWHFVNLVETYMGCGVDRGEINGENAKRQVLDVAIMLLGVLQKPADKIILRSHRLANI